MNQSESSERVVDGSPPLRDDELQLDFSIKKRAKAGSTFCWVFTLH